MTCLGHTATHRTLGMLCGTVYVLRTTQDPEDAMTRNVQMPSRPQGFLRRLTLATAWGEGLDGYDLGVLSVVLPLIATGLGISPVWVGLIGASTLIGIFLGSPSPVT